MTTSIARARNLIRSVADYEDPLAEMQRIVDEAPDDEVRFVKQMWEALLHAVERLAIERDRK